MEPGSVKKLRYLVVLGAVAGIRGVTWLWLHQGRGVYD